MTVLIAGISPFAAGRQFLRLLGAACSVYANGKEKMRETCES